MKKQTIRQAAENYEPKKTRNISELAEISTELDIEQRIFTDKDGEDFDILVTEIEGEEYRVPVSVLKQLKDILPERQGMTKFKVKKSGDGLSTTYTVIPLD